LKAALKVEEKNNNFPPPIKNLGKRNQKLESFDLVQSEDEDPYVHNDVHNNRLIYKNDILEKQILESQELVKQLLSINKKNELDHIAKMAKIENDMSGR
jgi:hypothetical protein